MLTLYARHLKPCEKKLRDRGLSPGERRVYRKCGCPVWVIGVRPQGGYLRQSLNTTNWQVAERLKQNLELGIVEVPKVTISAALDAWKAALLAAKRKPRTVAQVHGAMTGSLAAWSQHKGLVNLSELNLGLLDEWVGTWDYASTTHRGRIDLARSFFKFCIARKWITDNPAAGLIKPEDDQDPTLPFTTDEEAKLFTAAEVFGTRRHFGGLWSVNPETARALMLVMRWTGLRASDAVIFEPRRIKHVPVDQQQVPVYGTYQTKTGEWVMCPIPPHVAEAIRTAPRLSEAAAFLPAEGGGYKTDPRSVANMFYASYLCPLGRLAEVTNVHAHRFRDTFAVRLLEAGKPLEVVQKLLGHSSIKTTEEHYNPWVKSRAEMLIREVVSLWHTPTLSPASDE